MPKLRVWLLLCAAAWAFFAWIGIEIHRTITLIAQAIGG